METKATDKMLEKVRALIAKAEGTDNPAEAEAFLEKASALMLKHSIDEAMLEATRPAEQRTKPESMMIVVVPQSSPIKQQLIDLSAYVADHFGCKIVYFGLKHGKAKDEVRATVIGYPSDLRTFETLFTALSLDLIGRITPKPDLSKGFDENVYDLHEAGVKWQEIARLMNKAYDSEVVHSNGMPEWRAAVRPGKGQPDVLVPWPDGHRLINAYRRHCKAIGEQPRVVQSPVTYQRNFAQGYINKIWTRMMDMRIEADTAEVGTALALRSDAVEDVMNEMFPKLGKATARPDLRYDHRARQAGAEAGARADLGQKRAGSGQRGELA